MASHSSSNSSLALKSHTNPSPSSKNNAPSSTSTTQCNDARIQKGYDCYNLVSQSLEGEVKLESAATNVHVSFLAPKEDSIALDENSTKYSAAPILPMVPFNLQGKDVSQVSTQGRSVIQARLTSLPSSPSKSHHCRDIAELRDEILRMKKLACGKEHEDPRQRKKGQDEAREEIAPLQGQSSALNFSPLPKAEYGPPNLMICSPLRKDHAKLASPSKHSQNPQH